MQVKNISARGWWVMGQMIAPNETKDVEATKADIGDNPDLVILEEPEKEDDEYKGMTKAEIIAALKEKGVEFNPAAKKADLQAMLDNIKPE